MEDLHTSFKQYYLENVFNDEKQPTTYKMIECLKSKSTFSSNYIKDYEFANHCESVLYVDIFWSNKKEKFTKDYDVSITSCISKI